MTDRTFTRDQLAEIGVPPDSPDDIEYCEQLLADEFVSTLKYSQQRRVIFEHDGAAWAVEYEAPLDTGDFEVGGAPPDHGWWGDTVQASEVEQRPVVTQQWLPVDALADPGLELVLPAWEAMYEPGNVSDYLIGYANSEAAAKGAAIAWVQSQSDKDPADLEWVPDPQMATGEHDQWFELIENHGDGIPTGTGVNVRHRTQGA